MSHKHNVYRYCSSLAWRYRTKSLFVELLAHRTMSTLDAGPTSGPFQRIPDDVLPQLGRSAQDDRPVVLMTCGIAGSGKSTLAKAVIAAFPHFTRLSIDEIVFEKHGLYGVDYPADNALYQSYQEEASWIYLERFHRLLDESRDIVLDRSFYAKEDRDDFKSMTEKAGGRWVLVYLKADKDLLWKRICDRSAKTRDANSAFEISREIFEGYWVGFEVPRGEGEVIVEVDGNSDVIVNDTCLTAEAPEFKMSIAKLYASSLSGHCL